MIDPVGNRAGVMLMALSGGASAPRRATRFEERRKKVDDGDLRADRAAGARSRTSREREDVLSMLLLAEDEDGAHDDRRASCATSWSRCWWPATRPPPPSLAWTFELLNRNPAVRAKAEEGDDAYLDALVKEVLRIRPVISGRGAGGARRAVPARRPRDPAGHGDQPVDRRPSTAARTATRRPSEFRPERFLDGDAPDTYTWLPFGGGTRRCLGASFAMMEMRVVIRRVLERTDLQPGVRASPRRACARGSRSAPKHGARVIWA